MGTRHCIIIRHEGENKVAQYGQWDGYFEGQGLKLLNILKSDEFSLEKLKRELEDVEFFKTDEELQDYIQEKSGVDLKGKRGIPLSEAEKIEEYAPEVDRSTGADILHLVHDGKAKKLKDSSDFIYERLFCEFFYIIDLDEGKFESYMNVWEGNVNSEETDEDKKGFEAGFSFDLSDLPDSEEYLSNAKVLMDKHYGE